MDRELNPVFLKARGSIESVLDRHGFRLTREVFEPAAFGSAQAQYRHRAHWLSLNWDGKDSHLSLAGSVSGDQHTVPGREAWHSLDQPDVTISLRERDATLEIRIEQLVGQVERFLAIKAGV
jgi:hypothetical protein